VISWHMVGVKGLMMVGFCCSWGWGDAGCGSSLMGLRIAGEVKNPCWAGMVEILDSFLLESCTVEAKSW